MIGTTTQKGVPTMESSETPIRVLVVADRTAATQPLLDAVRERARRGPSTFTLVVPNAAHGLHKVIDPEDQGAGEARAVIDQALPLLSEAAGAPVEGIVGDPDPGAAVQDAINLHGFDEVIVSTLPARLSRWLKLDLPSKISGMGLPVTTVTPSDEP
jgi:nucleotide-binding universal stress UspA family protein